MDNPGQRLILRALSKKTDWGREGALNKYWSQTVEWSGMVAKSGQICPDCTSVDQDGPQCQGTLLETCIEEHGAAFCLAVVWDRLPDIVQTGLELIFLLSQGCVTMYDLMFWTSSFLCLVVWGTQIQDLVMLDKHLSTEPLSPSCSSLCFNQSYLLMKHLGG